MTKKLCPVCGSTGEDLVFTFECTNPACQNYARSKQSRSEAQESDVEEEDLPSSWGNVPGAD